MCNKGFGGKIIVKAVYKNPFCLLEYEGRKILGGG